MFTPAKLVKVGKCGRRHVIGWYQSGFRSLWVSPMLSRLWSSCMGSWFIVGMDMHDVVMLLC